MYMESERATQPRKWVSRRASSTKDPLKPGDAARPQRRLDDARQARAPEAGYPLTQSETQQLLRKLEQLTEANSELEAFNAAVAHDLCTPLTAINGYCQVLREICRDQLDENSREYLQRSYEGTLRMKEIIVSLLDFSRLTGAPLSRERVDLSGLANLVARELALAWPQRQVSIRVANGITAYGDTGLWRSVLDNLLGNAWKYSAGREQAVIEFGVKQLAGKAVCFVRDNGPGFDMAQAARLFEPFQRVPGTGAEGHGIGLATVDRIVRRHGGRVWAESKPGAGATFFFTTQ